MPVDYVIEVSEDFWLLNIMFLLVVLKKIFCVLGKAVDVGFSVGHGAGITVP